MEGTHHATKKKVVTLQRERKITGRSLWGEKYPLSNIMSTFERDLSDPMALSITGFLVAVLQRRKRRCKLYRESCGSFRLLPVRD